MNYTTEPVRDMKKIKEIFAYLKGKNLRDYMIAKTQFNTALRISDILKLKVSDFLNPDFTSKEYLTLTEKKTDKEKMIAVNQPLKTSIEEYVKKKELTYSSYLFQSRKSQNKPISTTQAHRIFQDVGKALGIEKFNTHSLRKSWGYFAYKETKNIALIMDAYNHTSEKDTLRYIGINQDQKNLLYLKIKF